MRDQNLQFIYDLKREGIKYDLSAMLEFDREFKHPHKNFESIHVTGSNGKGSVSNMVFNVLRLREKTGLYTSPHLINFAERIYLQDHQIEPESIEKYLDLFRDYIKNRIKIKRNPTFFEVTTEMAFQYYSEMNAKYSAIEVGLGGRLDATNIITPAVSIITRINYEHTDRLGTTLQQIAWEKGGIIKHNVPVVIGETKDEPLRELKRIAERRNSKLYESSKYTKIEGLKIEETGSKVWLHTPTEEYKLEIPLIGEFQVENARTAITALEILNENVKRKEIERGIANSRWPGRIEVVKRKPLVILDSSHNPAAAEALARTIKRLYEKKPLLVVGMLLDKDHYGYLHNMASCSDSIILTTPEEEERKTDPEVLEPFARKIFKSVEVIKDPIEAYNNAISRSDFVLVSGSMYLVGAICKILNLKMTPHR